MTLPELLVCVTLISILVVMLFPASERAQRFAQSLRCTANLRTLMAATTVYVQDHEGHFPATYSPAQDGPNLAWWWELYTQYCDESSVFACPADKTGFSGTYKPTWTRNGTSMANGKVSYGVMGHVSQAVDYKPTGRLVYSYRRPASTVFFTEYHHADKRLSERWCGALPRWISEITFPHSGKTGIAFMDGHIVMMSKDEMTLAAQSREIFISDSDPATSTSN